MLILADEIEDPHNLGALIRTAECCGAHGIVIPKRRSAGLSPTVYKSSAGAVSHLPVVRVANLASFIDELKKQGVWFYCADMDGEDYLFAPLNGSRDRHITRQQYWNILNRAASQIGYRDKIGCHSLRKTLGHELYSS